MDCSSDWGYNKNSSCTRREKSSGITQNKKLRTRIAGDRFPRDCPRDCPRIRPSLHGSNVSLRLCGQAASLTFLSPMRQSKFISNNKKLIRNSWRGWPAFVCFLTSSRRKLTIYSSSFSSKRYSRRRYVIAPASKSVRLSCTNTAALKSCDFILLQEAPVFHLTKYLVAIKILLCGRYCCMSKAKKAFRYDN